MTTYLTISDQAIEDVAFRMPSPAPVISARLLEPATARAFQLPDHRTGWLSVGDMPVRNRAALQHQDGRTAGTGGCDVTDIKFAPSLGPPSCSPPV